MLNKLLKYLSNHNIKILLYLDFILLPLALFTSVFLRLGGEWDMHLNHSWWVFILLSVWTIPIFIKLGLYRAVVKYLDAKIVVIVLYGVSLSVFILIAVIYFAKITAFPKSAVLIFWIFALAYIGGSRLILRGMIRNLMYSNKNLHKKKIAIYGAGHAGVQLCLGLQNTPDYSPVLFIDDDYKKSNTLIRGITVFNPTDFNEIQMLIENFSVDQIVIAIPSLSLYRRQEIIRYLEPLAVKILTLPAISQLMNGNITISDIKEIEIEDLLGRDVIPADHNLLEKNINNLNVLVTGAGGSEKISLVVEGAGVTKTDKGRGQYTIQCTQPGTAIVRASDGKTTQEFKIPIKRVPSPVPMVNGKQGGDMTAAQFKAAGGVSAKLVDFIFEGYSFKVVSFAMYFTGAGFEDKNEVAEVNGNAFSAEARKYMNRCTSGTTVVIGAIRVADQIGNVRDLEGNMTFVLE